jgi:hypothetical protein
MRNFARIVGLPLGVTGHALHFLLHFLKWFLAWANDFARYVRFMSCTYSHTSTGLGWSCAFPSTTTYYPYPCFGSTSLEIVA